MPLSCRLKTVVSDLIITGQIVYKGMTLHKITKFYTKRLSQHNRTTTDFSQNSQRIIQYLVGGTDVPHIIYSQFRRLHEPSNKLLDDPLLQVGVGNIQRIDEVENMSILMI
jgi:hypothetical protein